MSSSLLAWCLLRDKSYRRDGMFECIGEGRAWWGDGESSTHGEEDSCDIPPPLLPPYPWPFNHVAGPRAAKGGGGPIGQGGRVIVCRTQFWGTNSQRFQSASETPECSWQETVQHPSPNRQVTNGSDDQVLLGDPLPFKSILVLHSYIRFCLG